MLLHKADQQKLYRWNLARYIDFGALLLADGRVESILLGGWLVGRYVPHLKGFFSYIIMMRDLRIVVRSPVSNHYNFAVAHSLVHIKPNRQVIKCTTILKSMGDQFE